MDKSQKYTEVEHYLKQKHDITGGNCGTTPAELINALDTDYSLIKQALNALYKQGKIERTDRRKNLSGAMAYVYKVSKQEINKLYTERGI